LEAFPTVSLKYFSVLLHFFCRSIRPSSSRAKAAGHVRHSTPSHLLTLSADLYRSNSSIVSRSPQKVAAPQPRDGGDLEKLPSQSLRELPPRPRLDRDGVLEINLFADDVNIDTRG
jgi:hypothetical protein